MTHYHKEAIWEYTFNLMHFKEVLAEQGGNFFYHFNMLRMNYGELVYLPILWFSYIVLVKRNWYDAAIFIWFWVPYVFFSFSATKMQAYTLFAAPAVFLIIARAFYSFKKMGSNAPRNKWMYMIFAYGMVFLPIRYSIERIKPFTEMDRNPEWFSAITEFKHTKYNNPRTVVLNCGYPIEMMFETDCVCYPGYGTIPPPQVEMNLQMDSVNRELMPVPDVISKLQQDGYVVVKEKDGRYVELRQAKTTR